MDTSTAPPQEEPKLSEKQQQIQQIQESHNRIPIRTYHCTFCSHLLIATTQNLLSLPRRKPPALDNAIILPLPKPTSTSTSDHDDDEGEEEENDDEEDDNETENDPLKSNKKKPKASGDGAHDSSMPPPPQRQPKSDVKTKKADNTSSFSSGHYTILLSTTTPDRKPIILRRADGFEKRLLVRCGRCKVVLGYVLDEVHFQKGGSGSGNAGDEDGDGDGDGDGDTKGVVGGGGGEAPQVIYVLPGALVETGELGKEVKVEKEEWGSWEELLKRK